MNLSFSLETIYENVNFRVDDFDKVGVVGVNGAGKTTLFKVILNEQELDSGKISINNKRVGYLPQEIVIENENLTVLEYIESARPIKKLETELVNLYNEASLNPDDKIMKRISKVQEKLDYYEPYKSESIMLKLIEDMDVDIELLDMKLKDLSGGQKSKIAFLRLLYSKSEILLLDEPTNHLDIKTKKYVENYLKNYKGMVLIISHDVSFLNNIVNKIMYIDKVNHSINMFDGNYDIYIKKLNQQKELKEKRIIEEEREIKELKNFVEKARQASATNHNLKRMGKDRQHKLEVKLANLEERDKKYSKLKLNIKPNREGSKIPIKVNNISFNYEGKELLYNNLSFVINNNERFLIVGENGVGKSTLLKLIIGKLKPNEGTIWYGAKTDIAYYAQELELLDLNKTILENVDKKDYSERELRTILGSFMFYGDDVFKKCSVLSPGEKARVSLCKILLEKANLLILDEPTNHLDPETQQIIGENFKNYEGTIIVVSHNPSFVNQIGINRMLILPRGKITNYSSEKLEYYSIANSKDML